MPRIIITDDEPMNLRMTEFLLQKNGYDTILKASSGAQCLELLKDGADLVLLDMLMPEMNGLQTDERIREFNGHVPVIFLTSTEDNETMERICATGAGVVRKPFRPDELLNSVRKVLSCAGD